MLVVEASVEHHAGCASGFEKREEGEEFESEAENERKKANRTSRSKKRGEREERGLWSQSQARRGLARMMK